MKSPFDTDPYPGRPKILFIGLTESSHSHSWINLLDEADLNVRLFGLSSGVPPDSFNVRTYVTGVTPEKLNAQTRARFYSRMRTIQLFKKGFSRLIMGDVRAFEERWLASIIREWQPDVIHTLGLLPASFIYFRVRDKYRLRGIGKWVLQLRGGSDLTLERLDTEASSSIGEVLRSCDQLLSDNEENFKYAFEMGLREEQISPLRTVPGTGGVDVAALSSVWQGQPSARRIILWPKAYEVIWSKSLPVLEALKLCWAEIQPCEIHMLAMCRETRKWFLTLPEQIRQKCHIEHKRVPRERVLGLMTSARVMLAPSLVDGTPNSMFEAMATGALPIVSPLDTIRPIVKDEQNVLFARNLYPAEIAAALSRAMTDDALVDSVARTNLARVREIADRATIRPRVVEFYEKLAERKLPVTPSGFNTK
ncbi:MAG TPA: glycosyltransferase family 4 protein [Pyrinomonadaceae bacterium]|nr:glycosyltransferase family 4 protein [Pyrinomonadaceae bacterium]